MVLATVVTFIITKIQHLPGGWGIMVDDVLAGVYAALALHGWAWWIR